MICSSLKDKNKELFVSAKRTFVYEWEIPKNVMKSSNFSVFMHKSYRNV